MNNRRPMTFVRVLGHMRQGSTQWSRRWFYNKSVLLNNVGKDDDVQERLNRILQDIPKRSQPETGRVEQKKVEDVIKTIQQDGERGREKIKENQPQSGYLDTFNIKQIVDTVKEGENFKKLQEELSKFYETKWKEGKDKGEAFSKRLDSNVKELRKSIKIASQVVNDITGYSKVMTLRDKIAATEEQLRNLRDQLNFAKEHYQAAVDLRSNSQKEVNTLLERKNSWDQLDLERFTKLYMNNHDLEQAVHKAASDLKKLEDQEEEIHDVLIKSIMSRYHEEQTWSDKIRQFSTWATVLILCANVTLVLLVQLVFEPLKRWRLVSSFEGKVKDLFQGNLKLEQDLDGIRKDLKEFEEKMLMQMDNKGHFSLSSSDNGEPAVEYHNFQFKEPELNLQQLHSDSTRWQYVKLMVSNTWDITKYQFIHQLNTGIRLLYEMRTQVVSLWGVLLQPESFSSSGDLRGVTLTGISLGALFGVFIGVFL